MKPFYLANWRKVNKRSYLGRQYEDLWPLNIRRSSYILFYVLMCLIKSKMHPNRRPWALHFHLTDVTSKLI